MDTKQLITKKLEENKWFRERRNKLPGIARLLQEKYSLSLESSQRKIATDAPYFADILKEAESMNRLHRLILQEREDLRGEDYETGDKIAQDYEIKLGYTPNYQKDLKINTLF